MNLGNRLIMLHVGWIGGFLPPCRSHLQSLKQSRRLPWTNECKKFVKWGAKKWTCNFPSQLVIVVDNFPCLCLQVDRPLSACTVKTGMRWLGRKGIVSDETLSKNDLPVNSSTEAQKDINRIDHILANRGHAVRLPPYV